MNSKNSTKSISSILLGISGAGKTYGIQQYLGWLDPNQQVNDNELMSTQYVFIYPLSSESFNDLRGTNLKISLKDSIGNMIDPREQMEMYLHLNLLNNGRHSVINYVVDGTRVNDSVNFIKYDLGLMIDYGILPYQLEKGSKTQYRRIQYKGKEVVYDGKPFGNIDTSNAIKTLKVTKCLTNDSQVDIGDIRKGNYENINDVLALASELDVKLVIVGDSGEGNEEASYYVVKSPNGLLEKPFEVRANSLYDVMMGSLITEKERGTMKEDSVSALRALYSAQVR